MLRSLRLLLPVPVGRRTSSARTKRLCEQSRKHMLADYKAHTAMHSANGICSAPLPLHLHVPARLGCLALCAAVATHQEKPASLQTGKTGIIDLLQPDQTVLCAPLQPSPSHPHQTPYFPGMCPNTLLPSMTASSTAVKGSWIGSLKSPATSRRDKRRHITHITRQPTP